MYLLYSHLRFSFPVRLRTSRIFMSEFREKHVQTLLFMLYWYKKAKKVLSHPPAKYVRVSAAFSCRP